MRENKVVHQIPWVKGMRDEVINVCFFDGSVAVMACAPDPSQACADCGQSLSWRFKQERFQVVVLPKEGKITIVSTDIDGLL